MILVNGSSIDEKEFAQYYSLSSDDIKAVVFILEQYYGRVDMEGVIFRLVCNTNIDPENPLHMIMVGTLIQMLREKPVGVILKEAMQICQRQN